jgi:hypothetical protein
MVCYYYAFFVAVLLPSDSPRATSRCIRNATHEPTSKSVWQTTVARLPRCGLVSDIRTDCLVLGVEKMAYRASVSPEWPLVKLAIIAGSSFPITAAMGDFHETVAWLVEQWISFRPMLYGARLLAVGCKRHA